MPTPVLTLVMTRPDISALSALADHGQRVLASTFHKVSRVIPPDQRLKSLPSSTPTRDALRIMSELQISQIPILVGSRVVGIFSYRSFAMGLSALAAAQRTASAELPIEEFLDDDVAFADASDDVRSIVSLFDQHETILIGHRSRVTAIVTRGDIARYLYTIAEPFMLLEEIERSTRSLMRHAVADADIPDLIRLSLETEYAGRQNAVVPTTLERLTISELTAVLLDKRNWPRFESVFNSTRVTAHAKYQGVPTIRNDMLHFRAEWNLERKNVLLTCRGWLARRVPISEQAAEGALE